MSIFFLSDVHLGHDEPEREKLKLRKLDQLFELVASEGEQLYILGDLFDFWFEYKHAIPKDHLTVLCKLQKLVDAGVKLTYITGNHDFWLGDLLTRQLEIDVHRDQMTIEHHGKKIFLIHGDGLAKNDRGYRVLKKIMRNKLSIFLYRQVPPDIGIPFAKWCSRTSRLHTSKRPKESFLQEYRDFAKCKIDDGYDCVICAHTHVPEIIQFENGTYINSGDWCENFTYVVLGDDGFKLNRWEDR